MSNDIDKMCFADLIKRGQIRIPQIQRDYAQGRCHKDVKEIRNHFVRSLMHVVTGKKPEAQLDFIYGSDRKEAFEPLDGQQRLTTLFLLHWVLGVNLSTADGEPILTYETRNTSEAFCKELVRHDAKQFVDETHSFKPSETIQNRDWYQWGWRFDPTINSMLVMIDTICEQMDWTQNLDECRERLGNICFNHLDLGEMGMSDELFIKMNARGKPLSDFDKLKSTLEEEIQMQQSETDGKGTPLADSAIEHLWREHMDGKWIDLFWQRHANKVMTRPLTDDNKQERLAAAKETEKRLKIFLLRLIAIQMFTKIPEAKRIAEKERPDGQDEAAMRRYNRMMESIENLLELSYRMGEADLDNLLVAYQNQLIDWRSGECKTKPDRCTAIDFGALTADMNLWIMDMDNGQYKDVTRLLPEEAYFNPDSYTYFDHLTGENIGNDILATLYSMLCFLRLYPYKPDAPEEWKTNFEEWTRMSRNVFKSDNNNDRLNKRKDTADAFDAIHAITRDLSKYLKTSDVDIYSDNTAVLLFLKNINMTYKGIDNKSLEEEVYKASLRLADNGKTIDGAWTKAIRKAEKDQYLWGQIRCLLNWSSGNLALFEKYSDCLTKMTNINGLWGKQECYYNAMLCLFPDCWKSRNRLFEFNKDRDNSIKRYLRDDPNYGRYVRMFVDTWTAWNPDASLEEFCAHAVATTPNEGWVKYFKQRPHIIWESWRKRIFEDKGHVIFAQQKTTDSHCIDPMLRYIKSLAADKFYLRDEKKWMDGVTVVLHDSKSLCSHGLVMTVGESYCEIIWGDNDGEYVITVDNHTETTTDLDALVAKAAETIEILQNRYQQ